MTTLEFTPPFKPRTKPATQFSHRHGWNPSTPDKLELQAWLKRQIAEGLMSPICDTETEIHCVINFWMPIPTSIPKAEREAMILGLIPHINKPDISNMLKFAEDALSTVVWPDDRQVTYHVLHKAYSDDPCVQYLIQTKPRWIMTDEFKAVFGDLTFKDVLNMVKIMESINCDIEMFDQGIDKSSHVELIAKNISELAKCYGQKLQKIAKKLERTEKEAHDRFRDNDTCSSHCT